jgi:hypothetical protein
MASSFTSSYKEGVLWICIALKNPWPTVGFEPMNLGSNSKHADHYTTKGDNTLNTIYMQTAFT